MSRLGPYELNTIYCGECSEAMAALPANSIDFWLTSPPYGEMRAYNGYTFDFEAIAAQLYRVTKPGGVGVWVVADETKDGSESGTSFRQALGFMAAGFNLHDTMIWDKFCTSTPTQDRYYSSFEYMFVLSKGKPKTLNFIEDKPNITAGRRRVSITNIRKEERNRAISKEYIAPESSRRFNVWVCNPVAGQSPHPAPFPEALARDHILSWSNPGDLVLDPMVGSGTTAKQAHLLGRHYLGFDISPEYVELARRRVANVEAQPFLMPVVEVDGKPMHPSGVASDAPEGASEASQAAMFGGE